MTSVVVPISEYVPGRGLPTMPDYTEESLERDCETMRAEREALQQRRVRISYRADGWLLSGPEGEVVYLPRERMYWTPDLRPESCRDNAILSGHLRALNLYERALLLAQLVGAAQ